MDSLKVVAVASSEETRKSLLNQLQQCGFVEFDGVYIELSDAVRKCQEFGPDVIIVDLTGRELDGGLFIQAIGMNPENPCVIFALHKEMDLDIFKEAVRQGANEFIQYPEDSQSLDTALKKHLSLLSRVKTQSYQSNGKKAIKEGQLITLFSSKGGAGCSTISVNLAHEIKALKNEPVVYLDLDQVFCNSEVILRLVPEYSLGDLTKNKADEVDEALLEKITIEHESGLRAMVGSKSALDDNDMISPELLERILDYAIKKYAYVIVDLPTHVLDPYHQYLVERSDQVLVVSTPDIPSLVRTRQYMNLANKYLDMSKVKLVLNRYNMKAALISNQSLEEQFEYEIFCRIANDWDLNVEANSLGSVLSKVNPKAEVVRDLQKLAGLITGLEATPVAQKADKGGLLGKLFGNNAGNPKGRKGNVSSQT